MLAALGSSGESPDSTTADTADGSGLRASSAPPTMPEEARTGLDLALIAAARACLLLDSVDRTAFVLIGMEKEAFPDALIPDPAAFRAFLLLDSFVRPPVVNPVSGAGPEQASTMGHQGSSLARKESKRLR